MAEVSFLSQPASAQLGQVLSAQLLSEQWASLDVAVAWVRHSGTTHLKPALQHFVEAGGVARFTVGLDIENTSREGLADLLDLVAAGDAETYVYHNEAATTFHPKIYLLQNTAAARLFVGSNNMTRAGLFTNTEAALQVDGTPDDPLICDVSATLASWRDPTQGLARKLDPLLLDELVALGYVTTESGLRRRRRTSHDQAIAHRPAASPPLFASSPVAAPQAQPDLPTATTLPTTLLLRVRRASETARRTQVQIPIHLLRTPFFEGVTALISSHDQRSHNINPARARGSVNTMKVELPEINTLDDPVLWLTRVGHEVYYRAFDVHSPTGDRIMQALRRGLDLTPPQTHLTTRFQDREHATWWRFI